MLIGIDMLCVQSPEGGDRESGRFGRQLVAALLDREGGHRFVLYTHEGLPTHRIPSSRNAFRVSVPSLGVDRPRPRQGMQRVLDQNPEGLDWMVLLDPFEPGYEGMPLDSPFNTLKLAGLILDLAPGRVDDRRLGALRRYDALLAVSERTAADCRRRLGSTSARVAAIGLACDPSFAPADLAEPLTRASGDELGRLGINGPFLLANLSGGSDRANLDAILDAYRRLPFEPRKRHQLAIAGGVDDPWGAIGYLHERGCAEGLVLVGDVEESTLRMLYGRCAAFVSPSIDEGSGLTLVEAMRCGAPVVAGRSGAQPEILGDAGLLVDPADPASIATRVAEILADVELEQRLRDRARTRADRFGWGPVVDRIFGVLAVEDASPTSSRFRVDHAHSARPRVAVFADPHAPGSSLEAQVPTDWRASYQVDVYLEPEFAPLADGLPTDLGGFDLRQFDRNDAILSYHAVAYRVATPEALDATLGRLRGRPGLVFLGEGAEPDSASNSTPLDSFEERIREVLLTQSRVVVGSPMMLDRLRRSFPESADRIIDPSTAPDLIDALDRCALELPRGPGRRQRKFLEPAGRPFLSAPIPSSPNACPGRAEPIVGVTGS